MSIHYQKKLFQKDYTCDYNFWGTSCAFTLTMLISISPFCCLPMKILWVTILGVNEVEYWRCKFASVWVCIPKLEHDLSWCGIGVVVKNVMGMPQSNKLEHNGIDGHNSRVHIRKMS